MYRKTVCLALLSLLMSSLLIENASSGKLKKLIGLAVLAKALRPNIVPIPFGVHGLIPTTHSYQDPWAHGGGHQGGHQGGHGLDVGHLPSIHISPLPAGVLAGLTGGLGGLHGLGGLGGLHGLGGLGGLHGGLGGLGGHHGLGGLLGGLGGHLG